MKRSVAVFSLASTLSLSAASASAQAIRTWVANAGNDMDSCSATAPCRTFAAAFSRTSINGEINCLDAGSYGALTITKSITIDCHENFAGVLAGGVTGIIINVPTNGNDPLRTVRLRNISLNGAGASGTIGTRTGLNGIRIDAAFAVFLDNVQVSSFTQRGVLDQRTAAGKLYVRNSVFRDNGQSGLVISPSAGSATIDALVDNSHFLGNVVAGIAVNNGARMVAKRSAILGNGIGIDAEGTSFASQLVVDDSVVSGNAAGFFQSGGGSIRISNSNVDFNAALGFGTMNTFTSNRFTDNGAGGALAPIGAVTSPTGQQ